MFCLFRGAIDSTQNVIEPRDQLDQQIIDGIGNQIRMSENDKKSLNKAYSCNGNVSTNGGGNLKVFMKVTVH
jgi:hypothetical protein